MVRSPVSRRDFSKFAVAAMGGVIAGSALVGLSGCGNQSGTKPAAAAASASGNTASAMPAMGDMHACAGLNGCKGQGADGKNACAGQGGCASAAMKHECKGENACKGKGGCGEAMGANMCKGHGGCAVPMKDKTAWQAARDQFEAKMKAEGKTVGPAPTKS